MEAAGQEPAEPVSQHVQVGAELDLLDLGAALEPAHQRAGRGDVTLADPGA